jgi:hypothetical protein
MLNLEKFSIEFMYEGKPYEVDVTSAELHIQEIQRQIQPPEDQIKPTVIVPMFVDYLAKELHVELPFSVAHQLLKAVRVKWEDAKKKLGVVLQSVVTSET